MEVREWSEVGFRRQTEALQAASGELEVRRMRLVATYDARDCGGVSHAGGSECCSQPPRIRRRHVFDSNAVICKMKEEAINQSHVKRIMPSCR